MLRNLLVLTALGVSFGAAAQHLDIDGLAKSTEACVDFDEFVNGSWKKVTPMPGDRARIGSFDTLRDESRQIVERALGSAAANPDRLDTPGKRLAATYYASGMNTAAIERRGLKSLEPVLEPIASMKDRAQLARLFANLAQYDIDAPITVRIFPDAKDRKRYIITLDQGGLGLPDRDDYFRDDPRTLEVRKAYDTYRIRLAQLGGAANPQAASTADMVIETALAKASMTRVARRDPNAVYRLFTLETLAEFAPGLDWNAFFDELGVAQPGDFNVASPEFIKEVARLAASASLEEWRAYLRTRVLDEASLTLPTAFVDARFAYRNKAIQGLEKPLTRSEQVIRVITGPTGNEPLAEGLGQLYVEQAFSPEAKARAVAMVANIKAAMRTRIESLDWMSSVTKQRALRKLDAMTLKIGYPDRWKTYDRLMMDPEDYSGNWLRAGEWEFQQRLADIVRPVDRGRWTTSPHLVNAFAGGLNEIVFPAAILQPPFFYVHADDAVNYGAIGAVIGHEITHHFDDRGRQFDETGNLADWWQPADAEAYKKRAAALAAQYTTYKPLPEQSINGQQTLGENISDLGGILIAYDALQIANAGKPAKAIDGLTPDQRFFISFGTIWRAKDRPAALMNQLRTGQHSPSRYRVLGTLANVPAFGKAFNCPADAPMLRPAAERVVIW